MITVHHPPLHDDQLLQAEHERVAYDALYRQHEAQYQQVLRLNGGHLRPEYRADGTRILTCIFPGGPAELRYRPHPFPGGFIVEGVGADVRRTWGDTEMRAAVRHLLRDLASSGLGML